MIFQSRSKKKRTASDPEHNSLMLINLGFLLIAILPPQKISEKVYPFLEDLSAKGFLNICGYAKLAEPKFIDDCWN
ncbi:hypothetical protein TNCV_4997611 [Trichonephila clavipes]|nr:hypothetical protein TNCV_4997611 [Trichonephila clavipes]